LPGLLLILIRPKRAGKPASVDRLLVERDKSQQSLLTLRNRALDPASIVREAEAAQ
jgi:hypothetical protein